MIKACIGVDGRRCGARISTGEPRCPACTREHQRQRDARRGNSRERGYDAAYVANRKLVLANGPHPCAWGCGRIATTVDHLLPLAKGGDNSVENLMPCCSTCNASRGSRPEPSSWTRSPKRW